MNSSIQVYKKHSFLYLSLAELSLYSEPQFHQVAETQSQLALADSPPELCLQKCQVGGHLALGVTSYPGCYPLRFSPFSLVWGSGPSRSPLQSPCPSRIHEACWLSMHFSLEKFCFSCTGLI